MVSGTLTHMGSRSVLSSLESVLTKLQAPHMSCHEQATRVQAAVPQEHWRSLRLGWGSTDLRDVPFPAVFWFNYDLANSWLNELRPKEQKSMRVSFVAGGISGMISATFTYLMLSRQSYRCHWEQWRV